MYPHQRSMYYEIKNFLEKDCPDCRIGTLAGVRRIGKTGVLTDLSESVPGAVYVDFRNKSKDTLETYFGFLRMNKPGVLLLDEITEYTGFYDLIKELEYTVYNKNYSLKVIISGSSCLHTLAVQYGPLGAGRSKLFMMGFLSFSEYLRFTGRCDTLLFRNVTDITEQDFKDYLQLKGLEGSGLNLVFNRDYMEGIFSDMNTASRTNFYGDSVVDINEDDLYCVLDMVAYSLTNWVNAEKFRRPDGSKEFKSLNIPDSGYGMRLTLSVEQIAKMESKNILKALFYLLEAKLAYVETCFGDEPAEPAGGLVRGLLNWNSKEELIKFFDNYNVCLVSPLWYTRLAEEILDEYEISFSDLLETSIYGGILENYIQGSYCRFTWGVNYHIYKIGSPPKKATNEERANSKEVDLFDNRKSLLCEITVSNKARGDFYIMEHFPDTPFIRVLSTKDIESFKWGSHKIPYPKLAAMIDTGEIFKLEKTVKGHTSGNSSVIIGGRK